MSTKPAPVWRPLLIALSILCALGGCEQLRACRSDSPLRQAMRQARLEPAGDVPAVEFVYRFEPGARQAELAKWSVPIARSRVRRFAEQTGVRAVEIEGRSQGRFMLRLPALDPRLARAFQSLVHSQGGFCLRRFAGPEALEELPRGAEARGLSLRELPAPGPPGLVSSDLDAQDREVLVELVHELDGRLALGFEERPDQNQTRIYGLEGGCELDSEDVLSASIQLDEQRGRPFVSISFSDASVLGQLTRETTGEHLAIGFGARVHSAPLVREPIPGGALRLELGFERQQLDALLEAHVLVLQLTHPYPEGVTIEQLRVDTIPPSKK